jgi:hypothetical protein
MSTEEVIERVEREGGDPQARLRRAGALTFSSTLLPIDLAIRDWSRRHQAVAERLRGADNQRMAYLGVLFGASCPDEDDVEAPCMLAFSLLIGHHFMAADHRTRSRTDVLERGRQAVRGVVRPEPTSNRSTCPGPSGGAHQTGDVGPAT